MVSHIVSPFPGGRRPAHVGRPRRRWRLTLGAVAMVVAMVAGGPGIVVPHAAAGTTAVADPLLVVDVGALSIEEQLTFAALQGIVNRDAPTPYLVGLRSAQDFDVDPSAEAWLGDAVNLPIERISPDEARLRLLPSTKGLVVWDPAVPYESQHVATTIAGLEDLVPVDRRRLTASPPTSGSGWCATCGTST